MSLRANLTGRISWTAGGSNRTMSNWITRQSESTHSAESTNTDH